MPVIEALLTKIISAIVTKSASKGWTSLKRNDKILKILNELGLKPRAPEPSFDSVYAHTLIEYGVEQPKLVLDFFRHKDIKKAFEKSFEKNDVSLLNREAETLIEWHKIGDELHSNRLDPRLEFARFTLVFHEMVDRTRTPAEVRREQKLDEILQIIQEENLDAIRNSISEKVIEKVRQDKRIKDYLKDVIAVTYRIDLHGIYSRSGSGRELIYFPIEEHYTPLKTAVGPTGSRDDHFASRKFKTASQRVRLTDLLTIYRRLLIIGDPGGGKTTFLRLIACVLAKDAISPNETGRGIHLGLHLDKSPSIPIFIRFSALAGTLRRGCIEANGVSLWCVLLRTMEEIFGKDNANLLRILLDHGDCALLLDGLDEEPDPNVRKQMVDVANSVLDHWKKNLIVLTSRPFGYHAVSAQEKMLTAYIDSFGREEILEFLARWANAVFPEEEDRNRKAYLPELKSAVLSIPSIRRMAKNPVMLTCLCVVHWNERKLPEGKADLLAAVLRWLINAREEKRKARGFNDAFAEECFKALSFTMTVHPEGKQVHADLSWAAEQLEVPFRDELGVEGARLRRKGMDFLEAEMLDSGIVEQSGTGQLRFWHYTFQEHYAARALSELADGDGSDGWQQIVKPHIDDRQWDEVIDHFAGCLAWTGRRRLNLLVDLILDTTMPGDLASLARAVGVLGRILGILEAYSYQPPARIGWENARDQVMEIFEREGAAKVPVELRISAAEALGQGGDPRFKSFVPEMLPVPGMSDILLGRYAVTVKEYQKFIENRGYEDSEYWKEYWSVKENMGWVEPLIWEDQLEHLNRPVIGVSWFETMAYCNWLTIQTGDPFRLPKNEEWEKAATNQYGEYPWGKDEPDPEILNSDSKVGSPTPVGIYPAGAAPGGHLDMAGNVLEWNLDQAGPEAIYRVIRGGSWTIDDEGCRSALRFDNEPDIRSRDLGFRLAGAV